MTPNKAWYVIYTATPLNETPLLRAFREKGVDIEWWNPKFQAVKQLKKKTRSVLRPVFATYAFAKCEYSQNLVDIISSINGCYFVPGASKYPTPISDSEMEDFKARIKEYTTSGTISGNMLPPNSEVEIISGALAGYTATVKATVRDTVIVEINMFDRTVPLTLKQSEISAL